MGKGTYRVGIIDELTQIDRRISAFLYRIGLFKANLSDDGETDNRRAIQARLDIDGEIVFEGFGVLPIPPDQEVKFGGKRED